MLCDSPLSAAGTPLPTAQTDQQWPHLSSHTNTIACTSKDNYTGKSQVQPEQQASKSKIQQAEQGQQNSTGHQHSTAKQASALSTPAPLPTWHICTYPNTTVVHPSLIMQ